MNKRGQLGETLTWFAAFIIIFFIIIGFLSVTTVISAAKKVPIVGAGSDKIVLSKNGVDMGTYDSFMSFLQTRFVQDGKSLRFEDAIYRIFDLSVERKVIGESAFKLETDKLLDAMEGSALKCKDVIISFPNFYIVKDKELSQNQLIYSDKSLLSFSFTDFSKYKAYPMKISHAGYRYDLIYFEKKSEECHE